MWCFSTTRAVASPFPKTNEATRRSEIQRFRVNQVRESPAGQQQRPVGEAGDVVADDDLAERGDVDAAEPAPGFPLVSGCPDLPRLLAPREQCPVLVELHAPACEAVPFRVPLQVLPGFAAVRRPGDDGALEGVDGAAGRLDQGQPLVVRPGVPGHARLAHRDFPQLAAAHVQDAVAGLHASQLVGGHGAAAQGRGRFHVSAAALRPGCLGVRIFAIYFRHRTQEEETKITAVKEHRFKTMSRRYRGSTGTPSTRWSCCGPSPRRRRRFSSWRQTPGSAATGSPAGAAASPPGSRPSPSAATRWTASSSGS